MKQIQDFLGDARTILAFGITVAVGIGITILSWAIITTTDDGVNTRAQLVFNAVLPLFGTWVGTVLAYYFSRENFEAATSSTERLVQLTLEERLRSVLVANVMIKNIFSVQDLSQKVVDILRQLQGQDIKRLLILQQSGALEALLHREGVISYLLDTPDADRPDKTLNDLLKEKPDLKQTPAFVNERATLADAKNAMEKIANCKIVLVTKNGDANEPVVGLLTNTDIAKHSTA
jgi:hypothetical protein